MLHDFHGPKCADCGYKIPEGGTVLTADYGKGKQNYCIACNRKLMGLKLKKEKDGATKHIAGERNKG